MRNAPGPAKNRPHFRRTRPRRPRAPGWSSSGTIPAARGKSQAERSFADRAAINAPLQGAAADIMRRAMIRMPQALVDAGLKAKMLLQVHDELVFEAPEAEAEAVIAVARRVMERAPEPAVALTVPLVVDARAAANWDDAH